MTIPLSSSHSIMVPRCGLLTFFTYYYSFVRQLGSAWISDRLGAPSVQATMGAP